MAAPSCRELRRGSLHYPSQMANTCRHCAIMEVGFLSRGARSVMLTVFVGQYFSCAEMFLGWTQVRRTGTKPAGQPVA
jgi:hypothetical protein